jgi:opacity protein-like surface antigen
MKQLLLLTAILLVASVPGLAQSTSELPRIETYVNYQWLSADVDALETGSQNGWGTGVQFNARKWLSGVAEFNGSYASGHVTRTLVINPLRVNPLVLEPPIATITTAERVETNAYTYLFGPRASWRSRRVTAFAHSLFGWGSISAKCSSCGDAVRGFGRSIGGANKFAMALGGGIDINITPGIAFRAAQFDYVPIDSSIDWNGIGPGYLHNTRYQAGVVFRFKR